MRKRNKIKNYLETGVLLLGVLFLLINCKDNLEETIDEKHQDTEYIIETLSYKQIEKDESFSKLTDKFKIQKPTLNKGGKYISKFPTYLEQGSIHSKSSNIDIDLNIDMSTIKKITKNDYTSYTMQIIEEVENPDSFYNIVIEETPISQNTKFIKYTPTNDNQNNYAISMMSRDCVSLEVMSTSTIPVGSAPCDGGGDEGFVRICEEVIVMIEVKCTGAGHSVGQNCDCGVTVNCTPAYYTLGYEEVCYWDYIGSSPSPPSNPVTSNPGSSGSTSNPGANLVTSPVHELMPEGALQSIIVCIPNISPEQESWLINAQADSNNSSNFADIWNYIGENGCSPITQEVISESIDEALINPDAFEEKFKLKKECAKIKRLFISNTTLKQELIDLKNLTNETQERGKYKLTNSSQIQNIPIGSSMYIDIPTPTIGKYEILAHTHNNPANITMSVFSFEDIQAISMLLKRNKIKTNRFVFFVMTADGTNYAMTISDVSQFKKVFATKFDSNFDFNTSLNRYKQREEYYQGYPKDNIPPLIIENSNDNLKDEKLFLDFLENSDMGLTLFEVNNTFDTFERVTHNLITDNIDKENCN